MREGLTIGERAARLIHHPGRGAVAEACPRPVRIGSSFPPGPLAAYSVYAGLDVPSGTLTMNIRPFCLEGAQFRPRAIHAGAREMVTDPGLAPARSARRLFPKDAGKPPRRPWSR